ncbi:MAG: heparan-alpha-glucosaminide N-acetyltransferase domain-containing protein [Candidatus Heimdallarchaeaceae archaeon]
MKIVEQESLVDHKQPEDAESSEEKEEENIAEIDQKKKRYLSIDLFRGLTIVGMVFVNIVSNFDNIPDWSKHATDYGLTYVDLVAPFFIFAIALTYKMSFNRYLKREGYVKTYTKFIVRYGALVGFGFIGSIGSFATEGTQFSWGVLQAIGYAGIFTLFFIILPRVVRFVIGIGTLVAYQFILMINVEVEGVLISLADLNLLDSHGGVIGGIGYAALLLIGTAIIDVFGEKKKLPILISGIIFSIAGAAVHFIWKFYEIPLYGGISKERMTPSYVSVTLGLGAILFWLIWYLFDIKEITKGKSYFLQPFGRNAFFLYIFHHLLILLATLYLPQNSHVALVIFVAVMNVGILWLLAFMMDKNKIYIVL